MIFIKSLIQSIKKFLDEDPMTYAASLAFYTVASLPAILLIAINVLSVTYDTESAKIDFLYQLNKYLGPSTVEQAEIILDNAVTDYNGILPQIIGLLILAFSATTVFISLQNGINRIWNIRRAESANGILQTIFDRLLSLALIASMGFIILVTLVLDSFLGLLTEWIEMNYNDVYIVIAWFFNFVLNLLLTVSIFTIVFKVVPDAKTTWKSSFVGGIFTAIMFLFGKFLIGLYLSSADVGSSYGASGSLVVFLFWVYYSSILIFFGSKFTYEYARMKNESLKADDNYEFVNEVAANI